ncbi:DUF2634 domain-containing protein [Paenibacillus popilliae]|uniref:DUF2634 domain-containing protein n=1 Tax=Paenibacillus popilliae ATCC 14706 TaxID=1212764 RepID=M9LMB2_PAEPP|nr:DUF2634 domain-containing protein [Paenibacillus popilliae]GAC41251.1 hypothetical protein PPOP_0601 [Paenibacillus popilliae ATCC 14706]
MPDLFPTFDVPALVNAAADNQVQYPQSWLYDFENKRVVMDGSGRAVMVDGLTAWAQWCIKAASTLRFTHLAYGPDFGTEREGAWRQPTRKATESELERTITEALIVDPRTDTVRDFAFTWSGDELLVSFTAIPVIGDPKRLEVKMNG